MLDRRPVECRAEEVERRARDVLGGGGSGRAVVVITVGLAVEEMAPRADDEAARGVLRRSVPLGDRTAQEQVPPAAHPEARDGGPVAEVDAAPPGVALGVVEPVVPGGEPATDERDVAEGHGLEDGFGVRAQLKPGTPIGVELGARGGRAAAADGLPGPGECPPEGRAEQQGPVLVGDLVRMRGRDVGNHRDVGRMSCGGRVQLRLSQVGRAVRCDAARGPGLVGTPRHRVVPVGCFLGPRREVAARSTRPSDILGHDGEALGDGAERVEIGTRDDGSVGVSHQDHRDRAVSGGADHVGQQHDAIAHRDADRELHDRARRCPTAQGLQGCRSTRVELSHGRALRARATCHPRPDCQRRTARLATKP